MKNEPNDTFIGKCEMCEEEMAYAGWYQLCGLHYQAFEDRNYKGFGDLFKDKGYHPYR